jgi:hypothetical protein
LACAATVEDEGDGEGGAEHQADADAAVAVCGPYAEKMSECYAGQSEYGGYSYLTTLGYCIGYLGYGELAGGNCRAAMEDHFACLATLECEELLDRDDDESTTGGSEDSMRCPEEQAAVGRECPFGDD